MGLNHVARPGDLFSSAWVDSVRTAPESAMAALILITDPNVSGAIYDPEIDHWTQVVETLYTGKARVQPIGAVRHSGMRGNDSDIQFVRISIPISTATVDFRPGQQVEILSCALNPSLISYKLYISEIVDSSNPVERTLMTTVNQETANG